MSPEQEAKKLVGEHFELLPPFTGSDMDFEEYTAYVSYRFKLSIIFAIKQIEAIIKFGNEMNIREPMMKYNKILEELKKL